MALLPRPGRRESWEALRLRLLAAAGPGATASEDGVSWVAWHEGPSIAMVQEAVGSTPGWQWAAVAPALRASMPPPAEPGSTPTIWVRRSFSDRALAVALVRFYGSAGRYFTTADERHREPFARLLDVADPASAARYPIVEAITTLLLERQDPDPVPPTGDAVDDLSDKLRHLGYENLWAIAFHRVH
jgi:hypothetical protein